MSQRWVHGCHPNLHPAELGRLLSWGCSCSVLRSWAVLEHTWGKQPRGINSLLSLCQPEERQLKQND